MQLQCLSRLQKQRSAPREPVYYVPASPVRPAGQKSCSVWSPAPAPAASPMLEPEPEPARKASGKLDPLATEVLEEVRKSVSAPRSVLTRRYTWGGEMEEPLEGADSHPAEGTAHERRIAELLLPGLKRELRNTPPGERGPLLEELAEVQRCLGGDGIPNPRVFEVSRFCGSKEVGEVPLPALMRSASW